MPNQRQYLQDSLELNLFFLRIMKEHALFLLLGFTPKNKDMAMKAQNFRELLEGLFEQTIRMSKGYISSTVMSSGELFTPFTEAAENKTHEYTGVPITTRLTIEEYDLAGNVMPPATMKPEIDQLNTGIIRLLEELQQFQKTLLVDVLACRVFTMNYPLVLDHIIRETAHYMAMLSMLMSADMGLGPKEFAVEQAFWNDNLAEHAEFTNGLLDPSEIDLKNTAQSMAEGLFNLEQQALMAAKKPEILPEVTMRSKNAAVAMRDFDAQGTKGLLSCKVRSVIIPLLADHDLREANHYIRMLSENMMNVIG